MLVAAHPIKGGFRLASAGAVHFDLLVMARPRLVETRADNELVYDRFWCYPTTLAAIAAFQVWEPAATSEPVGYTSKGGPSMRPAAARRR